MQPRFECISTRMQEAREGNFLAPYATFSRGAHETRRYHEAPHPYRSAYQRDRDRIIHARAFRRLKHKRQVFLTTIGDHYRTRLTHTMEVAQLSRTIARVLGINEDLTEAVALGHDLGHTPFGHLGETVLDEILHGKHGGKNGFPTKDLGGFKHNYQSLRVVDLLERQYDFPGLNLTAAVREGILKHTSLKKNRISYPQLDYEGLHFGKEHPTTLEGQVVSMADEIAQRTHDLEDGVRAGLVGVADLRQLEISRIVEERSHIPQSSRENLYAYRNRLIIGLIDFLVHDLLIETLAQLKAYYEEHGQFLPFTRMLVRFSDAMDPLQKQLNKFIYERIIFIPSVREADEQARQVILLLYQSYQQHPELLPQNILEQCTEKNAGGKMIAPRVIADHIAGMTDTYAIAEIRRFAERGIVDREAVPDKLHLEWM